MSNTRSDGKKGFSYHFFGFMNIAFVVIMIVMILALFQDKDRIMKEAEKQKGMAIEKVNLTPIETSEQVMEGFTISNYQLENKDIQFYEIEVGIHNYSQEDIFNYEFEFPHICDSNERFIQFEPNTYYGPDDNLPTSSLRVLPPGESIVMRGRIMIEGDIPEYLMYYKSYDAYQNGEAMKIDMYSE